MFEIVDNTFKQIVLVYIAFMSACLILSPFVRLILTAFEKRGY